MTMRRLSILCVIVATLVLTPGVDRAQSPPPATPLARSLAQWQDMRFGLFLHWGPVSLTGREIGWSRGAPTPVNEYDELYLRFNPQQFSADDWARAAKAAGMKYVVLTAKHHDGFCLWDTKTTDYNVMKSPFGRDVVRELADACRRQGLVFGVYYSILDWHHPDYPLGSPAGKTRKMGANMDRYVEYLKRQVSELVTNYGPLGILWFDGEWEEPWTPERGADLYSFLRRLRGSLIINNRVSKPRAGTEGTSATLRFSGDYDTPEQRIGTFDMDRPWETCMTIGEQWAWKPDDALKPLAECVRTLVTTAGGNGNLLLNVGPMPDGRIEPRQVERLRNIGAWLSVNGESVYGTRGGPFKPGAWGVSTRRGNRIYLHVFTWEGDSRRLPPIAARVAEARVVGGGPVTFSQTVDALVIRVAADRRDPTDTVIRLDLDRPAAVLAPLDVKAP